MTGNQSAEFPDMAQQAAIQYLTLEDGKVAARLPIPAGELMLSRIRNYGWIEIRGEKQHTAIKLTPAGHFRNSQKCWGRRIRRPVSPLAANVRPAAKKSRLRSQA